MNFRDRNRDLWERLQKSSHCRHRISLELHFKSITDTDLGLKTHEFCKLSATTVCVMMLMQKYEGRGSLQQLPGRPLSQWVATPHPHGCTPSLDMSDMPDIIVTTRLTDRKDVSALFPAMRDIASSSLHEQPH